MGIITPTRCGFAGSLFCFVAPIIFNYDCNYIHVFIIVVEEQMMIQVKFSLLIQDAMKWVFT